MEENSVRFVLSQIQQELGSLLDKPYDETDNLAEEEEEESYDEEDDVSDILGHALSSAHGYILNVGLPDGPIDPSDRATRKMLLLVSVNEAAKEELLASVAVMRSEALGSLEQPMEDLLQRLEDLRTATGPKKRGRKSKMDWKVAQKAEMKALKSEIDEIR
jgi:hypothetical protein